ncbi:hypothetical protein Nmel_016981 [Mimus melanotis]
MAALPVTKMAVGAWPRGRDVERRAGVTSRGQGGPCWRPRWRGARERSWGGRGRAPCPRPGAGAAQATEVHEPQWAQRRQCC